MKQSAPQKARYGSGSLKRIGRIWHAKWREVRRHPDGRVDYVQHRESTRSDDYDFAQKFLNRKLAAVGGRRPAVVDPTKVSYDDLRNNFLERCVEKKRRSLKKAKDGTITLDTIPRLDQAFGGWKAAEITTAHVRRFRQEGKADSLSDKRLNRYVATLRAMFYQAAKDDLITRAEMPSYFPTTHEPNEAVGAIFIEPRWYEPLRKQLPEPLRSAFTLAYTTAIRVNEMLRLRWRDVILAKHYIELPGAITKTGRNRAIPLPSDFSLKPGKPDDLVFPLGDYRWDWYDACCRVGAGHFECQPCGTRCDERRCPKHGKNPRHLKYHGPLLRHTRHTAVRNMDDAGLPQTRIMAVSGHLTDSMFRRYNIGRERDVAQAREVIERFHRKQQRRR
jgi:integrase